MIRFIKHILIKTGIAFMLPFTGCVTLGSNRAFLTCILLITISTYIAEFSENIANTAVTSIFLRDSIKIWIIIIHLIICTLFLIIIPYMIIQYTKGIQPINGFIQLAVVIIIWCIGYIPENKQD